MRLGAKFRVSFKVRFRIRLSVGFMVGVRVRFKVRFMLIVKFTKFPSSHFFSFSHIQSIWFIFDYLFWASSFDSASSPCKINLTSTRTQLNSRESILIGRLIFNFGQTASDFLNNSGGNVNFVQIGWKEVRAKEKRGPGKHPKLKPLVKLIDF